MSTTGMHCPLCLDQGPDLHIDLMTPNVPLDVGIGGEFSFVCEGCGPTWRWAFTRTAKGFAYQLLPEHPAGTPKPPFPGTTH
jgi:hypothetical protein